MNGMDLQGATTVHPRLQASLKSTTCTQVCYGTRKRCHHHTFVVHTLCGMELFPTYLRTHDMQPTIKPVSRDEFEFHSSQDLLIKASLFKQTAIVLVHFTSHCLFFSLFHPYRLRQVGRVLLLRERDHLARPPRLAASREKTQTSSP